MNNQNKIHEKKTDEPVIPANVSLPEITFRAVILGVLLTIALAAANAFLGLKVGVTVAASIPAAVISMGILRFFKTSNVLENTMVSIMASVGEALTAGIAFILPALLILGVWHRFDYWQTVITALLGGSLGVLFTIPLRRALLKDKTLRYPEATAIANVLKASTKNEKGDLSSLVYGGIVGSLIALFQTGFQVLAESFSYWVKTPWTVVGFGLGLSPALVASGYISGLNVAISVFVGVAIGWLLGVPALTYVYGIPDITANQIANNMWSDYIRYIGVGTMLIGGLWTMCTLIKPVAQSMAASLAAIRTMRKGIKQETLRTERDIPIHYVFYAIALLLIPIFIFINYIIIPPGFQISTQFRVLLSGFSTFYILIGGFVFCSISSYFAGLIGSTNCPVSGMTVSALLIICLVFMVLFNLQSNLISPETKQLVGSVIAIGSIVVICSAIAISNDTMQDLKVGQMMGATPWKQQTMLFLGVLITSFIVPPILQLLYDAYGIGGVYPRPHMNPAQMLAAPQAGLMATIAKATFSSTLRWNMIWIGALVAVICIFVDEVLKRQYGTRLPVLAVGLGIYLPLDSSVPIVIGGLLLWVIEKQINRQYRRGNLEDETKVQVHRHRGLLLCCGIVAGASIMGVLLAIPFAIKESSNALRIMPESLMPFAGILSIVVTFIMCAWIYKSVMRKV